MTSVDRRKQIFDLEEMVTKLFDTAHQLTSAPERDGILKDIEIFRTRVTALRQSDTPPSSSYC